MLKHSNRKGKVITNVISSSLSAFLIVGLSGCSDTNCNDKNLDKSDDCRHSSGIIPIVGSSMSPHSTSSSGFFSNSSTPSSHSKSHSSSYGG